MTPRRLFPKLVEDIDEISSPRLRNAAYYTLFERTPENLDVSILEGP